MKTFQLKWYCVSSGFKSQHGHVLPFSKVMFQKEIRFKSKLALRVLNSKVIYINYAYLIWPPKRAIVYPRLSGIVNCSPQKKLTEEHCFLWYVNFSCLPPVRCVMNAQWVLTFHCWAKEFIMLCLGTRQLVTTVKRL